MAGTAFVSYQVPEMQQAEVMLLVFAEQTLNLQAVRQIRWLKIQLLQLLQVSSRLGQTEHGVDLSVTQSNLMSVRPSLDVYVLQLPLL